MMGGIEMKPHHHLHEDPMAWNLLLYQESGNKIPAYEFIAKCDASICHSFLILAGSNDPSLGEVAMVKMLLGC